MIISKRSEAFSLFCHSLCGARREGEEGGGRGEKEPWEKRKRKVVEGEKERERERRKEGRKQDSHSRGSSDQGRRHVGCLLPLSLQVEDAEEEQMHHDSVRSSDEGKRFSPEGGWVGGTLGSGQ